MNSNRTIDSHNSNRVWYLDNLKIFLTILVVLYHSAHAYLPHPFWPYSPSNMQYISGIGNFLIVDSAFFMGLFFFISGYFIPKSLESHNTWNYLISKLLRLGLPVILLSGRGHLWYIENLLLFSIICLVIYRRKGSLNFFKVENSMSLLVLLSLILLIGGITFLIRLKLPIGRWFVICKYFTLSPAHYWQYIVMFCLGIYNYYHDSISTITAKKGISCLSVALVMIIGVVIYTSSSKVWNDIHFQWWFSFYESMMCVCISVGLLWLFRTYLNSNNKFWRWCAAQTYGVYVFHISILLFFQNYLDPIISNPILKFIIENIISIVYLFVAVSLLRMIPGVKKVL